MQTLIATRYVTPLREGGSLPAVVEASDGRLYVAKFRGAGQGPRALVAEWIAGELARACGLAVPALVRLELDEAFGRNEPDPEIRDLLRASTGANLGLEFLPGAIAYDPIAPPDVDADLASAIVWFDSYVMNVDRTPRNPNLLLTGPRLWLIDHGASLYFHHSWRRNAGEGKSDPSLRGRDFGLVMTPRLIAALGAIDGFAKVRDHVLLPRASRLAAAGATLREKLAAAPVTEMLAALPDEWLAAPDAPGDPAATREAYRTWLAARLAGAATFEQEAERARSALV